MTATKFLEVSNIGRSENGRTILQDVSFSLLRGQRLAISGATGSGKTTLLKILAGLVEPSTGIVLLEGERVKGPAERLLPGHPRIAYHSQHFELRNHYRVSELLDMAKKVHDAEANAIIGVCRISHLLSRWSNELSGGERQRIVLALALLKSPQLLLLDEPYSNLDPLHKNGLKAVVHDLRQTLDLSIILVSHEPADVLSWADEVLVLKAGEVVQHGSPQTIYAAPSEDYVAGLFGKFTRLSYLLAKALSLHSEIRMEDVGRLVRPEEFALVSSTEGVEAIVEEASFLGNGYELRLRVQGEALLAFTAEKKFRPGDSVFIRL